MQMQADVIVWWKCKIIAVQEHYYMYICILYIWYDFLNLILASGSYNAVDLLSFTNGTDQYFFDREIKIGSKILGKKHNDIWYRGTVVDMSNDMQVAEVNTALESISVSHRYLVMLNTCTIN